MRCPPHATQPERAIAARTEETSETHLYAMHTMNTTHTMDTILCTLRTLLIGYAQSVGLGLLPWLGETNYRM